MDKAKAMIDADNNRSFVVDVFDAGSNQKVANLLRGTVIDSIIIGFDIFSYL